jgi:hypothetical protein
MVKRVNKLLKVKGLRGSSVKSVKKSITECSKDKSLKKKLNEKKSGEIIKDSEDIVEVEELEVPKLKTGYKKKTYTECVDYDLSRLKVLKFLGWCPSDGCTCSITSGDILDKKSNLYRCIRCGGRYLLSELLSEEKKGLARLSLRERHECLDEMSDGINLDDVPNIPDTFKDIDLGEDWD